MTEEMLTVINTKVIPAGLIAVMFSLGLTLAISDFKRLLQQPKAAFAGLAGQLIIMPVLAFALLAVLGLPAAMATGLVILAACPGGVTSNAVVFAARGDTALSVTLTACSSLLTIITAPILLALAISMFYAEGQAPELNALATVKRLFQMTVLPVALGMLCKHFLPGMAHRLAIMLRPASMLILLLIIVFTVVSSREMLLENLVKAGPAVFLLNACALLCGYMLARTLKLPRQQQMTLGIEVGVQNATMATFLSLAVLNDWALAIVPTMYGCIMLINAGLFVRWIRYRESAAQAV